MLNFLPLFQEKKRKFDIRLLGLLIVLVVFLIFSLTWSMKPVVKAKDCLPADVSFYYEWTNSQTFENNNYFLFNNLELDNQINELKRLLDDRLTNVEEIIWFHSLADQNDNYLIRFSQNVRGVINLLKKDHPEYQYYQPNTSILLITKSDQVINSVKKDKAEHFALDNFRTGTNLYWQIDNPPEFLQDLSNILSSVELDQEVFANLDKKGNKLSFNLFNKQDNLNDGNLKSFNNVIIPDNFDLAIGFSSNSTMNDVIIDNLLVPIYDKLPYYGLNKENINNNLLNDNIILQYQDDWLMIRDNDWQDLAIGLAKTLEIEEVSKVLPDGTAYTELRAKAEQLKIDHQFQEQAYWQIDGLFGLKLADQYYLSNRQYLIEQVIKSNHRLIDIYADCLGTDLNIQDFVSLKTDKINKEYLNNYLNTHNIQYLDIFSYHNQLIQGYQLCLE